MGYIMSDQKGTANEAKKKKNNHQKPNTLLFLSTIVLRVYSESIHITKYMIMRSSHIQPPSYYVLQD